MSTYSITIKAFGEYAVLIEWPNKVSEDILKDILIFNQFLEENYLKKENWEHVLAYNSLTLVHRKGAVVFKSLKKQLIDWYANKTIEGEVQRSFWRLPVCYDSSFGIDLEEVSNQLELSVSDLITLHTKSIYTVYGIGFLPGFTYLGGLPSTLETRRRQEPRLKVEKGAVGLAGKQTGIYPQESPGGWNIIGNCPVPLFDAQKDTPCFLSVGDKIQFYAISKAKYDLLKIETEVGVFKLEKGKIDA
ncbi:MAG: 5-oxoprolinase subunit PxpB [Cellulophaga sp.]